MFWSPRQQRRRSLSRRKGLINENGADSGEEGENRRGMAISVSTSFLQFVRLAWHK